ncbi:MAG TPA: M15 family metallopeptidase [Thermoleophilaceae bacterium]|nr:M15 family metallopeptidase [Thermoleophilaceae bacterium]
MAVIAAVISALAAPAQSSAFNSSIKPLTAAQKTMLKNGGAWHQGCPVGLNDLRVLTVTYRGFDKHNHSGQLIVNEKAAAPLANVFHRLYVIHFPIRHLDLEKVYVRSKWPKDGDASGSFECRQAVPSPCSGGTGTGSWSNHAYGLAVDLNPVENPYVGCGMSRDRRAQSFRDRSRHRPGMVTAQVVKAFRSIGWGWGGAWTGNTKDYMHFSVNGH